MKSLLVISLFLCITSYSQNKDDFDWITTSKDNSSIIGIKLDNSRKNDPNNQYVWVRDEPYKDQNGDYIIQKRTDYETSMCLWVVNCSNQTFTIKRAIMYNANGNVISDRTNDSNDFHNIIPMTLNEKVVLAVCEKLHN